MPAKAKKRDQQVVVGNRRLKLTNLDKVLYPKAKTTKAEVIDYYARVADLILPHLKGRPLTLRRFPEGVGKPQTSFFEKNCPKHRPEWVKTTPIFERPYQTQKYSSRLGMKSATVWPRRRFNPLPQWAKRLAMASISP